MSDGSEKNSKGTVLEIQGSYYKVKLEDGNDVVNAQNASSVDIAVGDKVVIGYVDSLHNPIITSVYDKTAGISKDELKDVLKEIKEDIQQEILERDHPVGSPYFTFIVSDNPNNRFPGTEWVRVEENLSLVSAGDGINALEIVGTNSQSVRIDDKHEHSMIHIHSLVGGTGKNLARPATGTNFNAYPKGSDYEDSGVYTTLPNNTNSGSSGTQSNTQSFDNRPESIAIYMWRRVA